VHDYPQSPLRETGALPERALRQERAATGMTIQDGSGRKSVCAAVMDVFHERTAPAPRGRVKVNMDVTVM
jgi:hypothetical protein